MIGPARQRVGLALLLGLAGLKPLSAEPMAVTIDDLPLVSAQFFTKDEQVRLFRAVLDALAKHQVRAVAFVNAERMRPHHEPLMEELRRRGHEVGNHTFSHLALNDVPAEQYEADVVRGDEALVRFMTSPKYFRFPFLQAGSPRDKRDRLAGFLREKGYVAVPVTIDTDDWDFNIAYTRAVKQGAAEEAGRVARDYLERVVKNAAKARQRSREKLGREIRHILLMHLNHLNAEVLDELFTRLADDGWSFIEAADALRDPVYSLEDEYFGPQGLTWLERVLR